MIPGNRCTSVKNPLPIPADRDRQKRGPCRAPPVARFAPPGRLRPPFVTHPATLLILIDALFSSYLCAADQHRFNSALLQR